MWSQEGGLSRALPSPRGSRPRVHPFVSRRQPRPCLQQQHYRHVYPFSMLAGTSTSANLVNKAHSPTRMSSCDLI